jgi:hypothetical protein
MQPLAVLAIVSGAVMVAGVSATLFLTRRSARPLPGGVSRWLRNGSIPLAGAALILRVISRSGQTPSTGNVIFATAGALLFSALLCAVAGAITQTRHRGRA